MKNVFKIIIAVFAMLLTSCAGSDYFDAIPQESSAIMSIDINKSKIKDNQEMLKTFLHVKDINDCGIDLTQKVYLFESPEGYFGLCAKVKDEGDLKDKLKDAGMETKKFHDFYFANIGDSWLAGFSDDALLLMGPITLEDQSSLKIKMARYLNQDEDEGIKQTPMFEKLDSIESPIALVAQAQAFPDKFVAPLTIGAPQNADASQILIAAKIQPQNKILKIEGETFSFDKRINSSLKEAQKVYRPIHQKYLNALSDNTLLGLCMNVEGPKFLNLLHQNPSIQALLAGINVAIDMDNIIKSVSGDMAISIHTYSKDNLKMSMVADIANDSWKKDIGYWKKSVPKGAKISDAGLNRWAYTSSSNSFYFGTSQNKQFYCETEQGYALSHIAGNKIAVSSDVVSLAKGQKMVMAINLRSIKDKSLQSVTAFMKPLFGNVNTILYILK
ncbi:MAG: DUF4836 family protein [Prevotella sp.]|jgi:hypothetical protein|nr:DUF4836 family protein [Prevotella sp.]MCI1281617.1 DUF4836 family protein [Prevotella sp.]